MLESLPWMMCSAGMRRCRREDGEGAPGVDGFLLLYCEAVHQGLHNTGWESAHAAPGSSGLAKDQRKVGDYFGEAGERAALDLGDVLKPRAVQRCACFILPTASWQDIACFDGKSAVLLDVQPWFMLHVMGPAINEQWSRDPIPGWRRAPHSHSPSGPVAGTWAGVDEEGMLPKKTCQEAGDAGKCGSLPTEGAPALPKAVWAGKAGEGMQRLPADLSQTVHGFPEQPRCQRCRAVTASQSLEEEGRGHSKGEEKAPSWKGGNLATY